MKPLVSVVIPVYNCHAFVGEAVRSALEQDHPNKEIIVVDDGSTDGSIQVLKEFGAAITLIQVPNGGPARARNTGLERALGEYVAFLDADDVWLPGKLSAQVEHLTHHPDVGTCFTGWHVWEGSADGTFRRPAFAVVPIGHPAADVTRSGWIYTRLLFDCELLTTTVMLRADTARRIGHFDVDLAVGEDYDFWLRMSQAAKITRLDCVGALYRILPNSASRVARARNFEHEVICAAIARFGLKNPDGTAVAQSAVDRRLDRLLLRHADLHLHQGNADVALRTLAQALRGRPWSWRLWAHAAHALWRQRIGRGGRVATRAP